MLITSVTKVQDVHEEITLYFQSKGHIDFLHTLRNTTGGRAYPITIASKSKKEVFPYQALFPNEVLFFLPNIVNHFYGGKVNHRLIELKGIPRVT